MSTKETNERQRHLPVKIQMPIKGQEKTTELFERATRFNTLKKAESALQEGIYGAK